ncbi:hypothetical protein Tco_0709155, partial [Tanacetum coccineum]
SALLVTPLPDSKEIPLREVEIFDPFFSLTHILTYGGSSGEGAALELKVPDESKGKSIDTHEGTGDDERTKSGDDKSIDLNKEEETQEDEFVHTLDDYVPTDDETDDVDDEEYDCINKEMYDDVNVELKDVEPVDEGNGDKEMTDAEKVNAEHEEVN